MTPTAGRAAVNRPSHLRRARGQRDGSITPNIRGLRPPRKSAIPGQARSDELRFPHQIFVDDLVNGIAKERPPVSPEPVVRRVVTSQLVEVITEGVCVA